MTALAARDALAKALYDAEGFHAADSWATETSIVRGRYEGLAENLFASGKVRDVATLADDEALVQAIAADQKEAADSWGEPLPGDERRLRARTALRALAAALSAPADTEVDG